MSGEVEGRPFAMVLNVYGPNHMEVRCPVCGEMVTSAGRGVSRSLALSDIAYHAAMHPISDRRLVTFKEYEDGSYDITFDGVNPPSEHDHKWETTDHGSDGYSAICACGATTGGPG